MANGGFYGGGKFFVGDALTFVDVTLYDVVDIYTRLANDGTAVLADYPLLAAHFASIAEHPRIKAYHASGRRPSNVNGASAYLDNDGAVKE